jgi:hypothetical protein
MANWRRCEPGCTITSSSTGFTAHNGPCRVPTAHDEQNVWGKDFRLTPLGPDGGAAPRGCCESTWAEWHQSTCQIGQELRPAMQYHRLPRAVRDMFTDRNCCPTQVNQAHADGCVAKLCTLPPLDQRLVVRDGYGNVVSDWCGCPCHYDGLVGAHCPLCTVTGDERVNVPTDDRLGKARVEIANNGVRYYDVNGDLIGSHRIPPMTEEEKQRAALARTRLIQLSLAARVDERAVDNTFENEVLPK